MARKPEEVRQAEMEKLKHLKAAKPCICRELLGLGGPKDQSTRLVMVRLAFMFEAMPQTEWTDDDIRFAFALVKAAEVLCKENQKVPFLV